MVYGIASGENEGTVDDYAEGFGLTFPILLDSDSAVITAYEQQMPFPTGAYPQDWVIGTDGLVVYVNNAWDQEAVESALVDELSGG